MQVKSISTTRLVRKHATRYKMVYIVVMVVDRLLLVKLQLSRTYLSEEFFK